MFPPDKPCALPSQKAYLEETIAGIERSLALLDDKLAQMIEAQNPEIEIIRVSFDLTGGKSSQKKTPIVKKRKASQMPSGEFLFIPL